MNISVIKVKKVKNESANHEVRQEIADLLLELLHRLLPHKEAVSIRYDIGEKTTIFTIACHNDDLGHLIGKNGSTVSALRQLLRAMSFQQNIRAIIEIPYRTK